MVEDYFQKQMKFSTVDYKLKHFQYLVSKNMRKQDQTEKKANNRHKIELIKLSTNMQLK